MNLFLLNWAGMQVVSALEAREHWNLRADDCVLIADPEVERFGATPSAEWRDIRWARVRRRENLAGRLLGWRRFRSVVEEMVKRHGPIERVFVGHEGGPTRHVVHVARPQEVVILDAGIVTAFVAERRLSLRHGGISTRQRIRQRVKEIAFGVSLDPLAIERATFFSYMPIRVEPPDLHIRPTFAGLRERASRQPHRAETWILGQNLIDYDILDEETYLAAIREICAQSRPPHIFIPHPRESASLERAVESATPARVRRFARPLELELALGDGLPRELWGFLSSALNSCSLIYGERLPTRSLRLKRAAFKTYSQYIEAAYDRLETWGHGLEVVESRLHDTSADGA